MTATPMCLVFVIDTRVRVHRVLLGLKRSGIGTSNVVGLGGHIEAGESARDAAVREAHEEAGIELSPSDLVPAGEVRFRFPAKPGLDQDVAVFTTTSRVGELTASDELTPAWYLVDALPLDDMWDDARLWLPAVLAGGFVNRTIVFADDNRTVLR